MSMGAYFFFIVLPLLTMAVYVCYCHGGPWGMLARFLAQPHVVDWLITRAKRRPYSSIVKDGQLYMERYWLFNPYPDTGASGKDRKRWQFPISIRLHHILLPDQDRDLHDHPWNARTVILRGWYIEKRDDIKGYYFRHAGGTAALRFGEYHRITDASIHGVWTLFITGRYRGTWGFLVGGIKVPWRKYLGLEEKA